MNSSNRIYPVFALIAVVVLAIIVAVAHFVISNHSNSGSTADMTKPATLAMTSTASSDTASVGDLQHITWTSSNYAAATVAVDIIRKVSDNPTQYVLVRQVASSTANDGDAVWVPAPGDVGPNTYVQVACVPSDQACTAAPLIEPLTVSDDGKNTNAAAAYQAIEAEYNN